MKTLVILSGGLDSTTVLHKCIADGHSVSAISFDYAQKHSKELDYACYWTQLRGIPHEIVRLDGVFSGSALTNDKPMPMTDYSVESMKDTVVPNRNMVMLSISISKAIAGGFDAVAYGAHAGDRNVYPDCRTEFVDAMRVVASMCDWKQVHILTPLIEMTKRDVVRLARELKIDIKRTWSCYEGGEEPCLKCGSCKARLEAMSA